MSGKKKSRLSRFVQSLVPTYGNYCGPGWTQGERKDEYDFSRKVPPRDDLDAVCQQHDIDVARKGPRQADADFVRNVRSIDRSALSPYAQLYAGVAEAVFEQTPGSAWFNEELVNLPEKQGNMTTIVTGPVAPMGNVGPQGPPGVPGPGADYVGIVACGDVSYPTITINVDNAHYERWLSATQIWKTPLASTEFGLDGTGKYIWAQLAADHVPIVLQITWRGQFRIVDWGDNTAGLAFTTWLYDVGDMGYIRLPEFSLCDATWPLDVWTEFSHTNLYYFDPAAHTSPYKVQVLTFICSMDPVSPGTAVIEFNNIATVPAACTPNGLDTTFTPTTTTMTFHDVTL